MSELARVRARVRRVTELPTLPSVYRRVAALVDDPAATAAAIEAVIENDPSLASKLLRLVNSAFFGLRREVTTIRRAVALVGFDTLKQLVLTTAVFRLFAAGGRVGSLSPGSVWLHSVATAAAAAALARRGGGPPDECFVGGLLHDVGVLFYLRYFAEEMREVVAHRSEPGGTLGAERAVLGQTHAETGRQLLQHWRLPARLVTVVAFHHRPEASRAYRREASIVRIADMLARARGWGEDGDELVERIGGPVWEAAGVGPADLDAAAAEVEAQIDDLARLADEGEAPGRASVRDGGAS